MKGTIKPSSFVDKQLIKYIINSAAVPVVRTFESLIQELSQFEQIEEVTKQFIDFITSIPINNDSINNIIKKISVVSYSYFPYVIENVYETFPPLNIDLNQIFTKNLKFERFLYQNFQTKLDVQSFFHRCLLYFLTNKTKAEILLKILQNINMDESFDFTIIFNLFFDKILYDLGFENNEKLLLPIIHKWSSIFELISNINPEKSFEYMVNFISSNPPQSSVFDIFKSISLELMPISVLFSKSSIHFYLFLFGTLKKDLKTQKVYNSLTFYLCSIVRQLLHHSKGDTTQGNLDQLFKIAKELNNLPLLTIFSYGSILINQTFNIRSILKLSKDVIKKNPDHVIYSFSIVIQTILEDNAIQINQMVSLTTTQNHFCDSEYMTKFIVYLAIQNFTVFVKDYFPQFSQNPFIEYNAIALFDSIKTILSDDNLSMKYPKECEIIRKKMQDVCYLYILDRLRKNPSSTTFSIELITDPNNILIDGDPQKPNFIIDDTLDVTPLKNQCFSTESSSIFEKFESTPLKVPNIMDLTDLSLINCVCLIPLLGYSDKLVSALTSLIFDQSIHIASLAIRAIQAIVYFDKKHTSQVLTRLLSLGKCETNEQLYTMMKCALVIEQISSENTFDDCLYPLIILGLCSTSREVRNTTFSLIRCSSKLSELFNECDEKIFEKSIEKIAAIFHIDSMDINVIPYMSFQAVANSQYQYLYHMFLSTFFSVVRHPLLEESRSFIFNYKPYNPSTLFAINLNTYLAASATSDFPSEKEFKSIISHVTTAILEGGEIMYPILFSFAASVSQNRIHDFFSILKGPNELFLRTFSFASLTAWLRLPSESIMMKLFENCRHIVTFGDAFHYFSKSNLFDNASDDALLKKSCLMLNCFCDFSRLITLLCDYYKERNLVPSICPYLHKQFVKFATETFPDVEHFFIFLLNLSFCQNKVLKKYSKIAIASFSSIVHISRKNGLILMEKMNQIILKNKNAQAASFVLLNTGIGSEFLNYFIEMARKEPLYFICISNLFEEIKSLRLSRAKIIKTLQDPIPENEKQMALTLYNSTGRLLALSMLYLSGDIPGYECESMKLLMNLIVSTSIINHQNIDFSALFDLAEEILNSNELILSYQTLMRLNEQLSKAFSDFSEDFIMESIEFGCMTNFNRCLKHWISTLFEINDFNLFHFILKFIQVFCRDHLDPPIYDMIYSFTRIKDILIICFGLKNAYHDETLKLLSVLLSYNQHFIHLLSMIFDVKFWLYFALTQPNLKEYYAVTSYAKQLSRKIVANTNNENLKPLLYSFSFIIDNKQNKHKLTAFQKDLFWNNCFDFAMNCGDFSLSIRALDYIINHTKEIRIDCVETAKNKLTLMSDIFINIRSTSNKIFIIQKYTSKLIGLLTEMNIKFARIDVFEVILSFLQFSDRSELILSSVLQSILKHSERINFSQVNLPFYIINQISYNGIYDNFSYMLNIYNYLSHFLAAGNYKVLSEKLEVALLTLYPYFSSIPALYDNIAYLFTNIHLKNGDIKKIIHNLSFNMTDDEIQIVLSFYEATLSNLPDIISIKIFEICAILILNGRNCGLFHNLFYWALKENKNRNVDSTCFFILTFEKHFDFVNYDSQHQGNRASPEQFNFPMNSQFEPFLFAPIDLGKIQSEMLNHCIEHTRSVVSEIYGKSFSSFKELKRGKSEKKQRNIDVNNWGCVPDLAIENNSEIASHDQVQKKMDDSITQIDFHELLKPKFDVFKLQAEEVDSIGSDLIDFPSIC